jgi:hypothetical protein
MVFSTEGWRRDDQRATAIKGAGHTIVGSLSLTNGRQVFDHLLLCVSFVLEMSDSAAVFFHKTSEFRDTHHQIPLEFRFFSAKKNAPIRRRGFLLNR